MRVNFRQGIVGHQTGSFLNINGSGHVDLLAANGAFTVNLAHKTTNYIHSEDNTFQDAWVGPFLSPTYWLYMDFNPLTFARTFGSTTLEPVAQSAEPGNGDAPIDTAIAGDPGVGSFLVPEHYVLEVGREFNVVGSTANDGTYTVASATFNSNTGNTLITVDEVISDSTADGSLTLDVDSVGTALLVDGRHWYDTSSDTHYIRISGFWSEVIRIFVAQLSSGVFSSPSLDAPLYTGTQIGNVSSVLSGRVLFDESFDPQLRDNRTFITTEDQFFTNQSRTDGIRLESNVSKAQNVGSTIAQFTAVAYTGEGEIQTAQYDDISTTVIGLLTENLVQGEVGSVVLQGVVTNPDWTWLSVTDVGTELWVENGIFVTIDPHVDDPVTYPTGRVPVARVLSNETIIFEQGLGGKGDKGPTGSVASLPPATVLEIGGCTLVTASSDPAQAFVISDTDSRLADSRNPLPHAHQAIDITYLPGFGVAATNLQGAIDELAQEKLNLAGGTMTGTLTLSSNPTSVLEAATKQYVDSLVSGLRWLDPVELVNLISDNVTTPPGSPEKGDAYVIPVGATGAWSALASGNVVSWDGSAWIDHGPVGSFHGTDDSRFIIALSSVTAASGSFAGKEDQIVNYNTSGTLVGFTAPSTNDAVYIHFAGSSSAFNQYAFDGTNWLLINQGVQQLTDLVDVLSTMVPNDGEALVFDTTNGWQAEVLGGGENWLIANNGVDFATAPTAVGSSSISIGNGATCASADSVCIGSGTSSTGIISVAIGSGATAAVAATSVGRSSSATGNSSCAFGGDAAALADSAIAIGRGTYARSARDICIGEYANTGTGGGFSITIGKSTSTASNVNNAVVLGSSSIASLDYQVILGNSLVAADVTSDSAYAVKLGHGSTDANKNFLHLYSKGKLELYGDEAQFVLPNYITGSIPATTVKGGLIYDTTTSELKVYDGGWNAIGGGGGGVANPLTADLLTAGYSVKSAAEGAALATGWAIEVGTSNATGTPGELLIQGGNNSGGGYGSRQPGGNIVLAPGINPGRGASEYAGADSTGFVEIRGSYANHATAKMGVADGATGSGYPPVKFEIFGGSHEDSGYRGGQVIIRGGNATGGAVYGGELTLFGGDSPGGKGGTVIIQGGDGSQTTGTSSGGQARLNGGDSTFGDGGTCIVRAGNGTATGRSGGDIQLLVGQGDTGADLGKLSVSVSGTATFGQIDFTYPDELTTTVGGLFVYTGTGSPNTVVTADVGAMYTDKAGGAGSTLYVKESGAGTNTGWVAK